MSKYAWRTGSRFNVEAQKAGDELERIRNNNEGQLKPAVIVEESKPEEAPLHPCFTWDDEKAAQLYREEEARSIVRSVRVIREEDEGEPEIAYVHVIREETDDSDRESCYVSTAVAMSDEELRAQVLADALKLLNGVAARYASLKELNNVFDAIKDAQTKFEEEQKRREEARKQSQKRKKA